MTTRPTFNLIDEPWIPCVPADGGPPRDLSLRETLARTPALREVADTSPLVTIALYRLLLAILHRTHGPATRREWQALWERGAFDTAALDAYFARWHGRFDLFDPERPFYQTPSLITNLPKPSSEFVFGETLGNYALLFDHAIERAPRPLSPAEAGRHLLAFHAFAVGGLIGYQPGEDPAKAKPAKAGPLNTSAVVLVRGDTLFETLLLNVLPYNGAAGQPFHFGDADQPAWERDDPIVVGPRPSDGYLDILTWQSRRLWLRPETDDDGQTRVRRVIIMKGSNYPDGWFPADRETMVAYRANPRAKEGTDPWLPLAFETDRALWRDSTALYQSLGDQRRPRTVDWIDAMLTSLGQDRHLTVDVFGLSTDQAKVLLWRHERLPLPREMLQDVNRVVALRRGLELAEAVGRLFRGGFDTVAISGKKPQKVPRPLLVLAEAVAARVEGQQPRKEAVQALVAALEPSDVYWSRLDVPFRRLVLELAGDPGGLPLRHWAETLRRTARATFGEVISGLGDSGTMLRAAAIAERSFNYRLHDVVSPFLALPEPAPPGEEHAA